MKLENQVFKLEQAKKLKELGVSQNTFLSWFGNETPRLKDNGIEPATYGPWVFVTNTEPRNAQDYDHRRDVCITEPIAAAFTVAELGEMFAVKFNYKERECFPETTKFCTDHPWIAGIHTVWAHDKPVVALKYFPAQTEAEARSAMLICLLEKNIISVEEVNERLTHHG